MQNKNLILFFAISFVLFAGWMQLRMTLWPPPPKRQVPVDIDNATTPEVSPVRREPGDAARAMAGGSGASAIGPGRLAGTRLRGSEPAAARSRHGRRPTSGRRHWTSIRLAAGGGAE